MKAHWSAVSAGLASRGGAELDLRCASTFVLKQAQWSWMMVNGRTKISGAGRSFSPFYWPINSWASRPSLFLLFREGTDGPHYFSLNQSTLFKHRTSRHLSKRNQNLRLIGPTGFRFRHELGSTQQPLLTFLFVLFISSNFNSLLVASWPFNRLLSSQSSTQNIGLFFFFL